MVDHVTRVEEMEAEYHRDDNLFSRTWVIDAPWAHPIWSQYLLTLFRLSDDNPDGSPTVRHREGDTHEMHLFALDPASPIDMDLVRTWRPPAPPQRFVPLSPMNYGYQFAAATDQVAYERVRDLAARIGRAEVSPDTDFRQSWDSQLFPDAKPLVRRKTAEELLAEMEAAGVLGPPPPKH